MKTVTLEEFTELINGMTTAQMIKMLPKYIEKYELVVTYGRLKSIYYTNHNSIFIHFSGYKLKPLCKEALTKLLEKNYLPDYQLITGLHSSV